MLREKIPGLALAVVGAREVLLSRGYGITSAEAGGYGVTPNTLFRIGSVTKMMTATAILRLVEAGKVELDAPVSRYIPWIEFSQAGVADRVTLRMLLTHTSGLPPDVSEHGDRDPQGLERFLRTALPKYPLIAEPGEIFQYSNPGYSLLGHVAEAVTGQSYPDLMNDLVFAPLGMDRTTLNPTRAMTYPLSQSHRLDAHGQLYLVRPFADHAGFAPAGFVYSNVVDLAKFARMLLSGGLVGGKPFLDPALLADMVSLQVRTYTPGGGGRGLGLYIDPHLGSGLARFGHLGGISGFKALLELYPDKEAAVIVVMNRSVPVGRIRDILLEECLGLPVTGWSPSYLKPNPADWPAYVGTYVSDSGGVAVVEVRQERLTLDWNGEEFVLGCVGPAHYASPWRDGAFLGVGFVNSGPGYMIVAETPFRCLQSLDAGSSEVDLACYAGTYRLKQPPMTVRVEDGSLLLHSAFYGQEVRCVPLGVHEFACKWGRFSFDVNHTGIVQGIRWANGLWVPRI